MNNSTNANEPAKTPQTSGTGESQFQRRNPLNKKRINTAVFFTLLYWLLVYFLVIKHKLIGIRWTVVPILALLAINLALILCSGFLQPVFEGVLKVTQKIGSLIFGLITTVVYFFILTPIALVKRLTGKPLLQVKLDRERETYYDEWESSPNLEKQY